MSEVDLAYLFSSTGAGMGEEFAFDNVDPKVVLKVQSAQIQARRPITEQQETPVIDTIQQASQ